ncbi:hypothetical protein B0T18DRAFT_387070 [Schizothecium vesticola]|uniref:Uncharacterized protein n=1 Tax=Schizothecium vesticola TaxID=314040 RepID=A0AA40F4L4_9PEZI|nr:hypothetical protein B0T18DRAFT_387070 [Schizothecium vesticola]
MMTPWQRWGESRRPHSTSIVYKRTPPWQRGGESKWAALQRINWKYEAHFYDTHPRTSTRLSFNKPSCRVRFRDELGGSLCSVHQVGGSEEDARYRKTPWFRTPRDPKGWGTSFLPAPDFYGYVDALAERRFLAAKNALTQPVGPTGQVANKVLGNDGETLGQLRMIEDLSDSNTANVGRRPTRDPSDPFPPSGCFPMPPFLESTLAGQKRKAEENSLPMPGFSKIARSAIWRPSATLANGGIGRTVLPNCHVLCMYPSPPPPSSQASLLRLQPDDIHQLVVSETQIHQKLGSFSRVYPCRWHPKYICLPPTPLPYPPPWPAEIFLTTQSLLRNYFLLFASFIRHQPLTSASALSFFHPNLLPALTDPRRLRAMADSFVRQATTLLRARGSSLIGGLGHGSDGERLLPVQAEQLILATALKRWEVTLGMVPRTLGEFVRGVDSHEDEDENKDSSMSD